MHTLLLGDFNIPYLSQDDHTLTNLLTNFNIMQHVTFPTHDRDNILDLIISHTSNKIVSNHSIGPFFADHFALLFNLSHHKSPRHYTTRAIRNLFDANISDLHNSIT